jgi:hypothetical protein
MFLYRFYIDSRCFYSISIAVFTLAWTRLITQMSLGATFCRILPMLEQVEVPGARWNGKWFLLLPCTKMHQMWDPFEQSAPEYANGQYRKPHFKAISTMVFYCIYHSFLSKTNSGVSWIHFWQGFLKMGVTRKSSTLIRFSIINHPCWGTSIYGDPHMFRSAESSVFLIAIFFIKNKWEADVRCVAQSTVKSDQFEVARSVCLYAIYCNSFVCSTMCPMTLHVSHDPGTMIIREFLPKTKGRKFGVSKMIPVSDGMSDTTQAIYRRQGLESTERPNCLFRATWANFSLLSMVSMVSMVFSVGFVQNFAFPVVFLCLFFIPWRGRPNVVSGAHCTCPVGRGLTFLEPNLLRAGAEFWVWRCLKCSVF